MDFENENGLGWAIVLITTVTVTLLSASVGWVVWDAMVTVAHRYNNP